MADDFSTYIQNAIQWALNRLGETNYNSRCLAFVEDAYEKSNGIEMFGGSSAKESADEYEAAQNTGQPPLGAFVFYDCSGELFGRYENWGHVGLYLGDGKVVHAWGCVRVDDYQAVESLPPPEGWTRPAYIGWSPVERILQGYRVKD
jgi:cell wall-associated NlpC family hydrolase